jgi:hypothetical protein
MPMPPGVDSAWWRLRRRPIWRLAGPRRVPPVIDFGVVTLCRAQFALTALYHFLFVPLTLGLSMNLVIMEAVYVMTGREI